ncbi:hypothetical protein DE146DRAFT_388590 [Phaeosphaeria sp. MPI-PUGE-AT-0046c]|nr:hypothetical protein DE146DRAFT_388590 [Phaeosphaeria sp. MPI-PUGE-AT-0046c]
MSTTTTMEKPLTLISATPSPFARMNRIALALKGIPFNLQNEIPWHSDTKTPKYNPLEKLPILLFPDDRKPVYDSAHIQQYIVKKYADRGPKLTTGDIDDDLEISQIVTLSEGCLDAIVLLRWEGRRAPDVQSTLWTDRQNRKVDGAMRAFNDLVLEMREKGKEYLVGEEMTIADIAVVCAVEWVEWAKLREGWGDEYPRLREWVQKLGGGKEFVETRPEMFALSEKVV